MTAEKAHKLIANSWNLINNIPFVHAGISSIWRVKSPELERELFGLKFSNPVGLAAGFDKDGKYIKSMSALGFGFIELGTVTPKPQIGNDLPRLFRLPQDQALINRMGFNNEGVDNLVSRLNKLKRSDLIIGGNIGKNKTTPNQEAVSDYLYCYEKLFPYVDYFVVNVSSPNTPDLRALQDKEPLTQLLKTLLDENKKKDKPKPILLKIAPDLSEGQLDDIISIALGLNLSGIIATNTTISRENLLSSSAKIKKIGNGGLSGKPIASRSTEVIRYISQKTSNKLPIIGVGGINSPEDAIAKLEAGASLIQIYSGIIYQGPGLISRINASLAKKIV